MLRILIEDSEGKSKAAQIDPESGDITIGRKEGNFIRLKERNVSRQHARIFMTADGLMIEPVAARYGLKLNSKKIDGPMPLQLGDEIRIGDYRLYIQDESQPSVISNDNVDAVTDIPPEMRPRLVVVSSNFAGREYHISRTKAIIGRNPECDIQISHQSVSGEHAEIRRNARGDFEVRDLNSSNGTKINGYALTDAYRINSGDVIMLGHVIMRYCAPGDFWSLNFGINDEPPRKTGTYIVFLIVAVVIAIALTAFVVSSMNSGNQTGPTTVTVKDDSAAKDVSFLEHLTRCKDLMDEGDFELAREACEEAGNIYPNDKRYTLAMEKLDNESSAKKRVDDIIRDIDDGKCREALDSIKREKEGTAAYNRMHVEGLKDRAIECLTKTLYNRAINAIENGDTTDAEMARDEIKEISPNSSYISEINEKIRASRPRSSGSGSSKSAAKKEDAPKATSSGDNVKELCIQAVQAKIKKNNCEAYKLYRKALALGGADATCTRNANKHLSEFKKNCE